MKKLVLAALVVAALVTSCSGGIESSMREFTGHYGRLASTLEQVHDVVSAEQAKSKIDEIAPNILSSAQDLAKAQARMVGKPDISMETMMACAQQQQRLAVQIKRLSEDEEVWPIVRSALEKTMVLNAMPPR